MKYPKVSGDPDQQAAYERMRRRGESHSLAEMLALRKVPGCKTEDTFRKGFSDFNSQFMKNPALGERLARKLREAGGSPSGKRYMGGLARFPGDPEAWVGGRDDIRKVCEKRGWECEGAVNVKMNRDNLDPGPDVAVAPDILAREVSKEAAADPGCVSTKKRKQETVRKVRDRIKPHWSKD